MRTLSAAAIAAVNAVVTAPGHLVEFRLASGEVARWSDVGQVTVGDVTYQAQDMKVSGITFAGDAKPSGFALSVGNLDSAIAAFILANDVASARVQVFGIDRAALDAADVSNLGTFSVTQTRIGIDQVGIACAPIFYTVPFRRVDASFGFRHATPAGTQITWGRELLLLDRLNPGHPRYMGP